MKRLTTYIPYFQDSQYTINVLKNLDSETTQTYTMLLNKIQLLTQYEIIETTKLFSPADRLLSKNFASYMLVNGHKPFAMNTFYLDCLQAKYNFILSGKAILDFGACDWDTSIVFANQHIWSKVYAFEPEEENLHLLKKNIWEHKKENIVIPVYAWVWEKNEILHVTWHGAWASITTNGTTSIEIVTIDTFVEKNNIIPGLMKRDIEGFEYASIIWAQETIKKHKPILLISIYHTGKDFFEIKPLIESRNLWYKFGLERQHSSHPFADTLLICY